MQRNWQYRVHKTKTNKIKKKHYAQTNTRISPECLQANKMTVLVFTESLASVISFSFIQVDLPMGADM